MLAYELAQLSFFMNLSHTLTTLLAIALPAVGFAKVERIWMTHQSADNNQIVVSWETTQPGDSIVEFGTSPALGQTVKLDGSRTLHHVEIPIPQRDVVYHYRVKTGDQSSEIHSFKGYPSQVLRIAVVANIRADAKLNFDAIRKDDPHLLLSSGDTAMQYQFATEADIQATKSHSTAIDTQSDLFRSTPLMVSLGNLDRKIRPNGLNMEEPGYDIAATGYRKFFALPDKEWIWAWDIPDFDLRFISVDMSHTGDFGKPNQACNAFDKDSEQFKWFEQTMNDTKAGFVITVYGETSMTVRRHAEGGWKRSIEKGTLAISGECYHAERTEVDGMTYFNSSVRGNGSFGHDPQAAFSDKAASYQLLTLDRAAGTLTSELKALEDGRVLDRKTFTKRK